MSTRNARKAAHGERKRYARKRTMPRRVIRDVSIGIGATLTGLVVLGACTDAPTDDGLPAGREVVIIRDGYFGDDDQRVMTQNDFPCAEDEVLGYDPWFGPDHVGCIHREDID